MVERTNEEDISTKKKEFYLPKPPIESAQMHITSNTFSELLDRNGFTINTTKS
jgi:hypothetical protein